MAKGRKTGGRRRGSKNKTTLAVRSVILDVLDRMGGADAMEKWAKANKTEFYKLAGRLVPTEVIGPGPNGDHHVTYTWER